MRPQQIAIDGCYYEPEDRDDLTSDMIREYSDELEGLSKAALVKELRNLRRSIDNAEYELSKLERRQRILIYAFGVKAARK